MKFDYYYGSQADTVQFHTDTKDTADRGNIFFINTAVKMLYSVLLDECPYL